MMFNISSFNKTFDEKLNFKDNFKLYIKEKSDLFSMPNFIVVSGNTAVGKSTLIKLLANKEQYKLIEYEKDLELSLPKLSTDDILCIDVRNFQELDLILAKISKLKNKAILTTIEYSYLEALHNWPVFISNQKKIAKSKNFPVHLLLTKERIKAENIF